MSEPKSRRVYEGPAILSFGFRPFFLAGALWAVVSVMLWLPQYFGELTLNVAFQPLDWHAHEALFGYVAAIVTGFLLTACAVKGGAFQWVRDPPGDSSRRKQSG